MKRNLKNLVLLIVIIAIVVMFLGGCCCCPTCPQETHPESVEPIDFCTLLEIVRGWTPLAMFRWLMSEFYDLVSKSDIEWALNQIGAWGCCMSYSEIIYELRQLEGYEKVPIGYVEYSNGTILNVVVCKEEGKIKAFLLVNDKFEELISDPLIEKIVI